MPLTQVVGTGNTGITDTSYGTAPVRSPDGLIAQKCYVTQNSASSLAIGHAVFLANSGVTAPFTGNLVIVEPFITASAVANSCYGFLAETVNGEGWAFVQIGGPGSVQIHGTGLTASYSHGQMVAFNTASGFVVTAAVVATTDAVLWARVMATGSVAYASAGTIASASTDTKTIAAYIMNNRFIGGY